MKKINICLCTFLLLTGLIFLSSSAFALQSGDFYYTVSNGTVTITGLTSQACQLTPTEVIDVIPDTIDGMPVVSIGGNAFSHCKGLNSITIPDSVTSIGGYAFNYCTGLTSVTIPSSVTSIGDGAFEICTGLTSVTIPNSVMYIGKGAFSGCRGLTSVTIPNSITSIEQSAFSGCRGLSSVTIPDSVTSIGLGAFWGDGLPRGVTIGNSVTIIGDSAFRDTGLTSVTIPNSVISIGDRAFSNSLSDGSLSSVTIGNSVKSIGLEAFLGHDSLTKAYFLGNAPSMEDCVFCGSASNFSVCYTAGATGFTTPTWDGYPAKVCTPETTTTTIRQTTTTTTIKQSTTTTTPTTTTRPPTVINLSSFTASPQTGKVILQWSTESETDNAGFNLYRSEAENGHYTKINATLIPARGSSSGGAAYEFTDTNVQNRKTYYYKLEDIDLNGTSTMQGPVKATPRLIYGNK